MPFAYFFTESEGFAGSRKVSEGSVGQPELEAELCSGNWHQQIVRSLQSELRAGTRSPGCSNMEVSVGPVLCRTSES